jgi:hypothetical protein
MKTPPSERDEDRIGVQRRRASYRARLIFGPEACPIRSSAVLLFMKALSCLAPTGLLLLLATCGGGGCGGKSLNGDVCRAGGTSYRIGESFPAGDGCNTCSCSASGIACTLIACATDAGVATDARSAPDARSATDARSASDARAATDAAGPDLATGCVSGTTSYAIGEYVPGLEQGACDACFCGPSGITCSRELCPGGSCIVGLDVTCNEDSTVTEPRGKCLSDGTCDCGTYPKSPTTGRCRALGHTDGYGCEYGGMVVNDITFTCADGCSTCYCQNDGVELLPSASCPSGSFCGVDQVYTFGDTMRVFSTDVPGQATLTPAATSAGPQATYVYTRDRGPDMPPVSCAPALPACGDPNSVDIGALMGLISSHEVQEILDFVDQTQQSLTLGRAPYDFSIQRGAGPRVVVGDGCDGTTLDCSRVPRNLSDLLERIHLLDLAQIKSPGCDVLAEPTFPCGTATCDSRTEYCFEWGNACRPYPPGCTTCGCAIADALPGSNPLHPSCGAPFYAQCDDGTQPVISDETSPTLRISCLRED